MHKNAPRGNCLNMCWGNIFISSIRTCNTELCWSIMDNNKYRRLANLFVKPLYSFWMNKHTQNYISLDNILWGYFCVWISEIPEQINNISWYFKYDTPKLYISTFIYPCGQRYSICLPNGSISSFFMLMHRHENKKCDTKSHY